MEGEPPPVEERRRLQEELSGFVESCCRTLEEVTSSLGWSLDRLGPGEEAAAEVRGAGPRGPEPAVLSGGRIPAGRRGEGRGSPARCRAAEGCGDGLRAPRRRLCGAPAGTWGLKKW